MNEIELQSLVQGRKEEHSPGYNSGKKDAAALINLVGKRNAGFDMINSQFESITDCSKGCSHCCHLFVDAMAFEVIAIHQYVRRVMDVDQQARVVQNVQHSYKEIKALSINEEKQIVRQCPLLNEKSKCSVYPVRPSNCAGMVSNDSSLCEKWKNTGSEDIEIETPGKIATWRAVELGALQGVAREHGDTVESFSLVRALNAVFKNPGVVQRWKKSRTTDLGPFV